MRLPRGVRGRTRRSPRASAEGASARPIACLGAAFIAFALVACDSGDDAGDAIPPIATPPSLQDDGAVARVLVHLSQEQSDRLSIRSATAEARSVTYRMGLPGTVYPAPEFYAEVSAPISGRIVAIQLHEGEAVSRGSLLARLESLELANLVAESLQAEAERTYQERQVERMETLVDRKIRPASTLDKAQADLARADALLTAAHARLHAIGITDDQLAAWGESSESGLLMDIRAPIDGVIAEHDIELGQSVTAYQTMMTLIDPRRVLVRGFLAPEEADAVQVGDSVWIRSRAGSVQETEAVIQTINPSLATGNRSVTLNILLDAPDGWPIPGQSVQLDVQATTRGAVIPVPMEAIEYEGDQATVFVRLDPLTWERRAVTVERLTQAAALVTSGLEEGEEFAVSQVFTLKALARFERYGEDEETG